MAELFRQFLFYSFAGFVLELFFARFIHAKKQDRKCMLFLPLCPVYGLGAVMIAHLPAFIQSNPPLLFLFGAAAATAAEYGFDWFYETVLGVRFWDYSALPLNLNGRVCLVFSLIWGLLALALSAWVHPWVTGWLSAIPDSLTSGVALLFSADTLLTVILLRVTRDTTSLRWYDRLRYTAKLRS